MSQINVNPPPTETHHIESVDTSGDRSAAAGINLITVVIVLAVLAVIAWYLFTGPLRAIGGSGTTVNLNTPPQPAPTVNINVNPAVQPSGNATPATGGGGNTTPTQVPSKP
jgi:hypothetical protein